MNLKTVTMQDCMEMYEYRGFAAVINDGMLRGFVREDADNEEMKEGEAC